jgi:hypothetical protein
MKKTDLAKSDAKKLMNAMGGKGAAFGAAEAPAPDRREQRERDRAAGLVPFAVKLNGELVKELQGRAAAEGRDLNELVGELLRKGMEK